MTKTLAAMAETNKNVARSNALIVQSNESMTKTLAGMGQMSDGVARSNALMTEMNQKLGVMTKIIEKIPGLKP